MTKTTKAIITTVAVIITAALCFAVNEHIIQPSARESAYNKGINSLESNPRAAAHTLEYDIPDFVQPQSHDEGYRDQYELIIYARILYCINEADYYSAYCEGQRIDYEYSGAFCEEIAAAQAKAQKLNELEDAKIAEKSAAITEENKRRAAESDTPYVGMSAGVIGLTRLGEPTDTCEEKMKIGGIPTEVTVYRWTEGDGVIFTAYVRFYEVIITEKPSDKTSSDSAAPSDGADFSQLDGADFSQLDGTDLSQFDSFDDFYEYYGFEDYTAAEEYWYDHT